MRFWMHVLCCLIVTCVSTATANDGWRAGVAKIRITPQSPMWMAGYASRNRPAEGTSSDLWAKALLLEDARGNRGLLITLDLIGISRPLAERWRKDLAQRYGLRSEQLLINTSHTHSGPVVGNNLAPMHYRMLTATQREQVDAYTDWLTTRVMDLVGQAIEDLQPAELAWGNGRCDVAVNRRNNPEKQVPQLRQARQLKGPTDHDVPVLTVRNKMAELRAVVFGYACHATVLSWYQWSADYPGYAQQGIEQQFPGAVALFWAGCGADQNPLPRRQLQLAEQYGQQLSEAVTKVVRSPMQKVTPTLRTDYREIDLAYGQQPTTAELAEQAQSNNRYIAMRASIWQEHLKTGKPLPNTYPYPIGVWKLGQEIDWYSLGGEVVVDFAVRLKSEGQGIRTWVAGYSHDVMAYIPSRRVLREGGYEGGGAMIYYGLPTIWSDKVEEQIINAAQEMAH